MNSPCNNVDEVKRMGESLLEAMQAQVCDRLIDRLGRALEVARTAARLRDEAPVELELRGLSRAEYDFIKAYLRAGHGGRADPGPARAPALVSRKAPSPKVVWLSERIRAKASAQARPAPWKH
jgi:hypothetical protein